jgi:hypothetical protein
MATKWQNGDGKPVLWGQEEISLASARSQNMKKRSVASVERLFRWRQNSFELLEFRGFLRQ